MKQCRYDKHEWVAVRLIVSTVYNCAKCGMKKEDWEKQPKEKTLGSARFTMRLPNGSQISNDGGFGDIDSLSTL